MISRFDDIGRIYIPKQIRHKFIPEEDFEIEGRPVNIFVDGNHLIINDNLNPDEYSDSCTLQYLDDATEIKTKCGCIIHISHKEAKKFRNCPYCGRRIKDFDK